MSLHLFVHTSSSSTTKALHLLAGYEDGGVSLLCFTKDRKWGSVWRRKGHTEPGEFSFGQSFSDSNVSTSSLLDPLKFMLNPHDLPQSLCSDLFFYFGSSFRSSVMSMTCSPLHNIAFSVSADEKIVRYNLFPFAPDETSDSDKTSKDEISQSFETKHAGRSTVDLSMDGKVLAVGGWDGR